MTKGETKLDLLLDLLEECASHPMQGHGEEWQELMLALKLPLVYWEAVKSVLDQGRWRKATNAVPYIRKAADREWRKGEGMKRSGPFAGFINELRLPRDERGVRMGHDKAIEYLINQGTTDDWETPYLQLRVRNELLIAESADADADHTINYPN